MPSRIEVELFAGPREQLGMSSIIVEVELPISVASLKNAIRHARPELSDWVDASRIAVSESFANEQVVIQPGDKIALIPPVSGG